MKKTNNKAPLDIDTAYILFLGLSLATCWIVRNSNDSIILSTSISLLVGYWAMMTYFENN